MVDSILLGSEDFELLYGLGKLTSNRNVQTPCLNADGDLCGTSYSSESLKHLVTCSCENSVSCRTGIVNGKGTLESIWNRATETCESNSFRNFLREKGKLASICFSGGTCMPTLSILIFTKLYT